MAMKPAIEPFKLGLLGYPIKHTLSPILQTRLLQLCQMAGEYLPYETPVEMLASIISKFGEQGGRGLNVTIPHKVAVTAQLDWISPEAAMMGAVNTLVFSQPETELEPELEIDKVVAPIPTRSYHVAGYNTDITGFVRSLPTQVVRELPQAHVALIGAGGSARAVLAGLLSLKTKRITVIARQKSKAEELAFLADSMSDFYNANTELHLGSFQETSLEKLKIDGLINTTPVGMWPNMDESPIPADYLPRFFMDSLLNHPFVYDLIYRPETTQLMEDASDITTYTGNELLLMSGLDMLIHQGIAAFELWTEQSLSGLQLDGLRKRLTTVMQQ